MKPGEFLKQWLTIMLFAVAGVLTGVSPDCVESVSYRVALLSPGRTFARMFDGLREGLARFVR